MYLDGCEELQIDPARPVPDPVELRAQLFGALTDEVWAEAATGFGDPELTSE